MIKVGIQMDEIFHILHNLCFMLTAATTYQIFGGNLSLYDYTILFPAVIGSLTVIVIFGLVRLFAGTTIWSYCIFIICSITSNTFTRILLDGLSLNHWEFFMVF